LNIIQYYSLPKETTDFKQQVLVCYSWFQCIFLILCDRDKNDNIPRIMKSSETSIKCYRGALINYSYCDVLWAYRQSLELALE